MLDERLGRRSLFCYFFDYRYFKLFDGLDLGVQLVAVFFGLCQIGRRPLSTLAVLSDLVHGFT